MKEKSVAPKKTNKENQTITNFKRDFSTNSTNLSATEKLKEIIESASRATTFSATSELQKTLTKISTPRIFSATDKIQEMIAAATAVSAPITTSNIQNIIESLAKPKMTDTLQEMIASVTAARVPNITPDILNIYSSVNIAKSFSATEKIQEMISSLGIHPALANSANIHKIISATELNTKIYSESNIRNIIQSAQDNFSINSILKMSELINSSEEIFSQYGIDINETIKEIEPGDLKHTINTDSEQQYYIDKSLPYDQIKNRLIITLLYLAIIFRSIIEQTIANILSSVIKSEFIGQETSFTKKKAEQVISDSELYDKTKFRLIIAHQLHVRDEPTINSPVVDTLKKGNIVLVLSKNKNWIEIGYKSSKNEFITGWVFTRYTKVLN